MYRIDTLLKQDRKLFHTRDLALLWGIDNDNTLYTVIKRYVQKGILIPIQKGFYSVLPLNKISPLELGMSFLHGYSFVSCEYVLTLSGIIFQSSDYITLVSSVSRKFSVASHNYLVRKLKPQYLFNDIGITTRDGIRIATIERAVADLLYFNPKYHFDNRKSIDWYYVQKIQKEVGYI